MAKRRVVLDVDVGIDDALMMLLLAADPNVEIVAVGSAHGNCSAAQAARNAIRVLDVLGLSEVPVALGVESPLPGATGSPQVHGHDGLADAGLPEPSRAHSGESSADQLIRLSRDQPGELDLIAVAPMTNLGVALAKDPDVLSRFRSVWMLGGMSREVEPGELPYNDANVFHSPEAADALFAAGANLTVIPINLSRQAQLEDRHIEAIRGSDSPVARFAWRILPFYFDFYQRRMNGRWTASMHDPLVAGLYLDESLVTSELRAPMAVEPFGERHRGMARDPGAHPLLAGRAPARIITDADLPLFLDRFASAIAGL